MTEHEGPSLDGRFAGRIAVVTGAASGLGRASATLLAREGAHVIAVDLNGGALREVVANLATPGVAVEGDIGEPSTVERYMDAGIDSFGRVDLYHLNAGIFGTFAPLPDLEVEEFDEVMRVNLRGQFLGHRRCDRGNGIDREPRG
jgi:NAD(P)-dependent dehydrogenase (short-subunit alcohol dehydrogenase family)